MHLPSTQRSSPDGHGEAWALVGSGKSDVSELLPFMKASSPSIGGGVCSSICFCTCEYRRRRLGFDWKLNTSFRALIEFGVSVLFGF